MLRFDRSFNGIGEMYQTRKFIAFLSVIIKLKKIIEFTSKDKILFHWVDVPHLD